MASLKIDHLCAFYGRAQALFDVTLDVGEGDIVAVIGANGAGKSTLLDSILGLTKTTGDIRLADQSVIGIGAPAIVRRGVGYAPERFNLFPYMSVRDNLLVGAFTAREDIEENLDLVYRLFPRLKEREAQETSTQSGGERQMVSLGRALMSSPRVLLVDEPTIGLAPKVCAEIAEVLKHLCEAHGLTILIAEQNANFAMSLAERVYVLESGRITAEGTPKSLASDEVLAAAYFGH